MRRLNEILAFPKAWYRKSIWKRMFIGEQTVSAMFSDQEEDTESESKDLSDSSSEESNKKPNKLFIRQESTGNRDSLWLNLQEKSTQ
jgi:hypothetical protein